MVGRETGGVVRRLLPAVVMIAAATFPMPARAASVPVLVVDGRGHGHGVGMAQDGAYWMGVAGARTEQILGHFYPGTSIGRGQGTVRVVVHDVGPAPTGVVIAFPRGGEVRDAPGGEQSDGFPVRLAPGEPARVVWDGGRYRVERTETVAIGRPQLTAQILGPTTTAATTSTTSPTASSTTTTTARPLLSTTTSTTTTDPEPHEPAPPTTPPPTRASPTSSRSLWAVPVAGGTTDITTRNRTYRGVLELTATTGTLRAINEVDVEVYLKGMGEVLDPTWPQASLRAQAIAARTYGLRAMTAGAREICDTQQCQVYLGAQVEYPAMNKAVDDTRGQVLVYGRALASAVYSANGGGHSASREEGFGIPAEDASAPYLRPAQYTTKDPAPWSVTVALDDVAARLGYAGDVTTVAVTRTGPSGRVLEVTLDGSAGPHAVSGIAFDASLGLKSTLFALRVESADVAPPAPPPAEPVLVQAPPEQAADVTATAPAPPRPTSDTADEIALVFASWAALAVAGAAVLTRFGRDFRPIREEIAPKS